MKRTAMLLLLGAAAVVSLASEGDDLTSLSYISYLERYATVQPAGEQASVETAINMPLVAGDRIDTAREARMEIFLADGNSLWLDEYTTLSLDAVAFGRDTGGERTVLFLAEGTIMVEVSEHALSRQPVRVDGRAATVYLSQVGLYRIAVQPGGGLRLEVWQGLAEASTTAGGVLVRESSAAQVAAGAVTGSDPLLTRGDSFAAWVEQRRQVASGNSTIYLDARYERQAATLDNYGSWVYVDDLNSWAWQPAVADDWQPYTAGRWYWTPTGWSWLSYEPWGWLPYHYGSWYRSAGFGWVWGWHPYWSPAWVHWAWWPGYVGWCPWGYYDSWYWPHYGHYYGYPYPPHHPGHPDGGYGGSGYPPRRDVVPPSSQARTNPATGSLPEPGSGSVARTRPDEPALRLAGRTRLSEIDADGWTVVADRDFASPQLARLSERGATALRDRGDQVGVVMSGPLATAQPSRARTSLELERVFREVEQRSPRDLSPLMARSNRLTGEQARELVEPTTLGALSRPAGRPVEVSRPSLSSDSRSPMSSSSRSVPIDRSSGPGARAPAGLPQPGQTSYLNPYLSRSRPSAVTAPTTGSSSVVRPPSGFARRPVSPSTATGSPSGSGPVIVPRTSGVRQGSEVRPPAGAARPSTAAPAPRSSSGRHMSTPSGGSPSSRPPSAGSGGAAASRPSGGTPRAGSPGGAKQR